MDVLGILNAVQSHAAASGHFDRAIGTHEPKNAPGRGLTCAIWVQELRPIPARSGLNATSVRLTLNVRLYSSMIQEPQDAIDPNLTVATDDLMAAYSGDFELGGEAAYVDLLGAHGEPLAARAGYLPQDGRQFRVMTINMPVINDDHWPQAQ